MNRSKLFGTLLCGIIFGSFGFLLLTPFVPNLFGQMLDEYHYQQALDRIENVRKGSIRIQIVDAAGNPIPGVAVHFNQTNHEFLFGAMFFHYGEFKNPGWNETYATLFSDVFNLALTHSYWAAWESPEYFPDEYRINESLAYCREHDLETKMHPLVWDHPAGIPEWLNIDELTQDEIRELYLDRVASMVEKYRDNVTYWDVVNEPVHRGTFGLDPVDFVAECFQTANSTNPEAHLILNDYGMMGHDFGTSDITRLINQLKAEGAPFDIIGMQSHAMDTDWVPTYEIWGTLDGYAKLGKRIHITEFMVPSRAVPITNSWKKGLWSPEYQAEYARRFYTTAFSHPACDAICWWGFDDRSNPTKNEGYGLVTGDLEPKPAYTMLKQLITQEWHTQGTVTTDPAGWIDFTGFYGTYKVSIDLGGSTHTFELSRGKESSPEFRIQIL